MNFNRKTCPPSARLRGAATLVTRKAKTAVRCTLWRIHQEFRVRRHRLSLLYEEWQLRSGSRNAEFRIWGWYGRIGNNVQQLIVAIAHAEAFNGRTGISTEQIHAGPLKDIIAHFNLNFSNSGSQRPINKVVSTVFFHYTEYTFSRNDLRRMAYRKGHSPRRDCLLGRRTIEAHAHRIAQQYLSPRLLLPAQPPASLAFDDTSLVIHLRSGDVRTLEYDYYITNPLCYYQELARQYRRAVIITEPGLPHPLLNSILSLFEQVEVVSSTARDDFISLCMAPNLATSGVGTFALAAALLSKSLKVFHCTDLYQVEHLNPRMIRSEDVQVRLQVMPGFMKQWLRSRDRINLLHSYQPPG